MKKEMTDITKELQEWIFAEEKAGRAIDMNRLNDRLQFMMRKRNSVPRSDFNGISPEQMHEIIYRPFGSACPVQLNHLTESEYLRIPLVKQALFLMRTLSEKELKLTKNGWLPLKVVMESYHLGRPLWIVEEYGQKRLNEYESESTWMARELLQYLGWTKIRKGMLSLTVKGKKAFADVESAANEILFASLTGGLLHFFDRYEDPQPGNLGVAYSLWLLNKFGDTWHDGDFYYDYYQKVFNIPGGRNPFETRVLGRLFYWLGIDDKQLNRNTPPPFRKEYRKTSLLNVLFLFKQ